MFSSYGKLIYDPKTKNYYDEWWLLMECCPDIINYYKQMIEREMNIKLNKPMWGSHVSIIRGEEPINDLKQIWGYNEGMIVPFKCIKLDYNEDYWWLDVESDMIFDIRSSYGLQERPRFGLHLTIGKVIR
jgi:hypothetical protein